MLGVILISLALCADAVIGNVQEKAMKLHNGSNSEMVNTRFEVSVLSHTIWKYSSSHTDNSIRVWGGGC